MMMSQCHLSKGLWKEPMIGQHIANAYAGAQTDKKTQIKISEISKYTKQWLKEIIEETGG